MKNFTFWNPTRVIFGKDTVPQIGGHTKKFGARFWSYPDAPALGRPGSTINYWGHCAKRNWRLTAYTKEVISEILTRCM
jgi:hypothetical protein